MNRVAEFDLSKANGGEVPVGLPAIGANVGGDNERGESVDVAINAGIVILRGDFPTLEIDSSSISETKYRRYDDCLMSNVFTISLIKFFIFLRYSKEVTSFIL